MGGDLHDVAFAGEVRLTQGIQNREQIRVAEFIEELSSPSTLDANARGVRLTVTPVDEALDGGPRPRELEGVLQKVCDHRGEHLPVGRND